MLLKLILDSVGQRFHVPNIDMQSFSIVHMVQDTEYGGKFLQYFYIYRKLLLSMDPDEDENEGFSFHCQVLEHESRTLLQHVIFPRHDRVFISCTNPESLMLQNVQCLEGNLVGMPNSC